MVSRLTVDGAGAFVLCFGDATTIGPASARPTPTLGLICEPQTPVVTLARSDESLVLSSGSNFEFAGHSTVRALARPGQRLRLSPTCALKLRQPHPASDTWLLDLDGARLAADPIVRRALLGQEIVIGPATTAHIRVRELQESHTLLPTPSGSLMVDRVRELARNETVLIEQIRLRLTAWDNDADRDRPRGGRR
jgi:hypothetical protein